MYSHPYVGAGHYVIAWGGVYFIEILCHISVYCRHVVILYVLRCLFSGNFRVRCRLEGGFTLLYMESCHLLQPPPLLY